MQGEITAPDDIPATVRAFVSDLNTISKVIRDDAELWRISETFLDRYGFHAERGVPLSGS